MIKYLKQYKKWYEEKSDEILGDVFIKYFLLKTLITLIYLVPMIIFAAIVIYGFLLITTLINLIVSLILWLFTFNEGKNLNKRIIKAVEKDILKEEQTKGLLHFNRTEKDIDISNFFHINTIKPTLDYKGRVQCDNNRRRSLGDIYRILKYYNKDITIKDVVLQLHNYRFTEFKDLGVTYCNTINKCVFTTKSTFYNSNCKTEFKLDGKHLTWCEIVEAYKNK